MKEKMEAQGNKSSIMGWVMYGVGVVAVACMFIPGVNLVAGTALALVSITGSIMNVVLQNDSNRCRQFMLKISKNQDSLMRQVEVISKTIAALDDQEKELSKIEAELDKEFQNEGFKNIDDSYMEVIERVVEKVENLVGNFSDAMEEVA